MDYFVITVKSRNTFTTDIEPEWNIEPEVYLDNQLVGDGVYIMVIKKLYHLLWIDPYQAWLLAKTVPSFQILPGSQRMKLMGQPHSWSTILHQSHTSFLKTTPRRSSIVLYYSLTPMCRQHHTLPSSLHVRNCHLLLHSAAIERHYL